MPIAVVQKIQATTTSGATVTGTLANTTTGNTIVAVSGSFTGASNVAVQSISISPGSGTFQKIIASPSNSPNNWDALEGWAAPNITGGTTPTITITYASAIAAGGGSVEVYELSGITGGLFGDGTPASQQTQSSANAMNTPPITTLNAGSIVFAAFAASTVPTAGEAGWNPVIDAAQFTLYQYKIQTSPQSSLVSTGTQTGANNFYNAIIFALSPVTVSKVSAVPFPWYVLELPH